MEKKHPVSGQTQDNLRRLKPLSAIVDLKDSTANKGDNQERKTGLCGENSQTGGVGVRLLGIFPHNPFSLSDCLPKTLLANDSRCLKKVRYVKLNKLRYLDKL